MGNPDAGRQTEPYGYYTQSGFRGRIKTGEFMIFPTYEEYIEYLSEE